MGSTSDWDVMQHCAQTLDPLGVAYRQPANHRQPQPYHANQYYPPPPRPAPWGMRLCRVRRAGQGRPT